MTTMRRAFPLVAMLSLLVGAGAAACGPAGDGETPSVETTAPPQAAPTPSEQQGLPPAVAETRAQIYGAASQRDFDALRSLIDPRSFTYSFGDGGDAIDYWQEREAEGEDPLGTLVELLERPYAVQHGIYVWPEEFATTDYYYDYRTGIERDGAWVFFVAGD